MKKRIRKKQHLGEFKQYGNIITINSRGSEETAEEILNMFENVIYEFSLTVAGGGTGRILLPQRKNNKYIPKLAAKVVISVAEGSLPIDKMMFCVYKKGSSHVPEEVLGAINDTFAEKNYYMRISESVNLWESIALEDI